MQGSWLVLAIMVVFSGCDGESPRVVLDSGPAPSDAGFPAADAGRDGGAAVSDAGEPTRDAGSSPLDAGPVTSGCRERARYALVSLYTLGTSILSARLS